MTIGLSQSTTFGIEGSTVVMCAKIYNGTTDRAISVYLSAISSTATGNVLGMCNQHTKYCSIV